MAQCPRLPDQQMTYRTYCLERSHSFVYFWPHNDGVKQLPVATKVWLFLVLDLSSRAKNVLESSTDSWRSSTLRMHSSCRDRSLDGKLDRGLDSSLSWCFCQSKTSLLSAEPSFHDSNRKDLCFGFQWLDSVTRLLPPNSRKRTWRCFQSFGECAWMASIMLFRIMVWDVHPIIYLHPTTEKEKVLLPPRNNREEIATSTQLFSASVARMTPAVNSSDFVILSFFFFLVFSQKLRGRVTRNIEKKAHGLKRKKHGIGE